jgi:hypothetical protein
MNTHVHDADFVASQIGDFQLLLQFNLKKKNIFT